MAILDDYKVWIESNGRPSEEYGVTVDEKNKTVSCWIESRLGEVRVKLSCPEKFCTQPTLRTGNNGALER